MYFHDLLIYFHVFFSIPFTWFSHMIHFFSSEIFFAPTWFIYFHVCCPHVKSDNFPRVSSTHDSFHVWFSLLIVYFHVPFTFLCFHSYSTFKVVERLQKNKNKNKFVSVIAYVMAAPPGKKNNQTIFFFLMCRQCFYSKPHSHIVYCEKYLPRLWWNFFYPYFYPLLKKNQSKPP